MSEVETLFKILKKLDFIEFKLGSMEANIMAAIDDLNTAITTVGNAVTVAVTDLQTLGAELAAANAANDTAAIQAAVGKLNSITSTLSAASASAIPASTAPAA